MVKLCETRVLPAIEVKRKSCQLIRRHIKQSLRMFLRDVCSECRRSRRRECRFITTQRLINAPTAWFRVVLLRRRTATGPASTLARRAFTGPDPRGPSAVFVLRRPAIKDNPSVGGGVVRRQRRLKLMSQTRGPLPFATASLKAMSARASLGGRSTVPGGHHAGYAGEALPATAIRVRCNVGDDGVSHLSTGLGDGHGCRGSWALELAR